MQPVAATEDKILATIFNYDDLVLALRARKDVLQLTDATIDTLSNLAQGHAGKLLGGACVKKFGPLSLGAVLSTLGVKLQMIEDSAARAIVDPHWQRSAHPEAMRASKEARIGKMTLARVFRPVIKEFSKLGNEARQKLEPAERQRIARLAAKARNRKLDRAERKASARLAARARWAKAEVN